MAVKLLADRIKIGNYELFESPKGLVFDGVIKAAAYNNNQDLGYKDTVLLVKGNGVSNANNQIFNDSSNNKFTVNRFGNACIGSFTPYANNYAVYFDGSGDYLSVSANDVFKFNATDSFLIECWVNFVDGNTNSLRMIWTNYNTWTTNSIFFGKHSSYGGRVTLWVNNYNSGAPLLEDPTLPPTGRWVHYAVQKLATPGGVVTWNLFRDGISVSTATWSGDPTGTNNNCQIGGNSEAGGAYCLLGWISNMRIMKGSVPYPQVANVGFVPFSTKMTTSANVSGIFCQNYRHTDSSNNNLTVTPVGTPQVTGYSPLVRPYEYTTANNGGSMYLDSSGDYLTVAANTAFQPGTGDFTFQFWYYPVRTDVNSYLFSQNFNNSNSGYANYLVYFASNTFYYYSSTSGSGWNVASAVNIGTAVQNTWNHIAVSRTSGSTRTFLNGTLTNTFSDTSDLSNSGDLNIGSRVAGDFGPGYYSDIRFEKGRGYTSINVPTTPLTTTSNTSLLLGFRDAGVYDATQSHVIETLGEIDVNTSVYLLGTGSKEQGSIYFDGTGDWMKIAISPQFNFANGDFTVEGWVNSQSNVVTLGTIMGFGWIYGNYSPLVIFNDAGTLKVYASSTGSSWDVINNQSFGTLTLGTWHHFAVSRQGNVYRLYKDGVAQAQLTSSSTLYTPPSFITLGADSNGNSTYMFNGYMQDIRVSRYARYTTAFFEVPQFLMPKR